MNYSSYETEVKKRMLLVFYYIFTAYFELILIVRQVNSTDTVSLV